jgi:hypothetical protein
MNTRALTIATVVGTILQLGMVLVGHTNDSVKALFAVGGVTISLVAGVIYARLARDASKGTAAAGGLVAGGLCALLGIIVSYGLGDVTAMILAAGTCSSAVTGAIGGLLGSLGGRPATATRAI